MDAFFMELFFLASHSARRRRAKPGTSMARLDRRRLSASRCECHEKPPSPKTGKAPMRIQMRRRDTAAIAVLTLMLTGMFGRSLADDAGWPQWLGPTRNAIAADGPKLLDSWPTNGPALVWRSEILGAAGGDGFSSVIVSGGKVFIYLNSKPPSGKTNEDPRRGSSFQTHTTNVCKPRTGCLHSGIAGRA
jgi:hypothetical protein